MSFEISGNAATTRTNLGLGDAATKTVGTGAGNVPVLDGSGQIADAQIAALSVSKLSGVGTTGQVLTSTGTTTAPTMQDAAAGGKVIGSAVAYAPQSKSTASAVNMEAYRGAMLSNVGVAHITLTYTPLSATSRLWLSGNTHYGIESNAHGVCGIFVNGTSIAIMSSNGYSSDGGAGSVTGYWEHGNTNTVTIELRIIGAAGGHWVHGGNYRYHDWMAMEQNNNRGVLQLLEVEA